MTNVKRASFVFCFFLAVSCFLTVRLYDLAMYDNTSKQVLSGQYTRSRTAAQRTGFVYDTNGKLLSHRQQGAAAIVNPSGTWDKNAAAQFLGRYSEIPLDEILTKISKPEPFIIALTHLPDEKAPDSVYVYPLFEQSENGLCRHILGYRNISGVGMDGIYGKFDGILDRISGRVDFSYISDAAGGMLTGEGFTVTDRGYTDMSGIVLTIDSQIQQSVDEVCGKYMDMGAVIVCNVTTGEMLAVSSRPLYDREDVAESLESDRGELINRAFSLYTPGSVFKTAVAAAVLEIDESLYDFEYECTGECDVSGKTFRCHNLSGHGMQTMKQAFANSCNTYFINLVEQTGFEYVLNKIKQMGMGNGNAVDGIFVKGAVLPEEGVSYPPAYKANFSFGQGDILTSPVDIMRLFCVCTTGFERSFSLVKGLYDSGEDKMTYFSIGSQERKLSDSTVEKMREMMQECVTSGTGKAAYVKGVQAGGKTATAQSGQYKNGTEVLHRWFAGVFPIDEPEYAVVVLCDGNGEKNGNPVKIFAEITKAISGSHGQNIKNAAIVQ